VPCFGQDHVYRFTQAGLDHLPDAMGFLGMNRDEKTRSDLFDQMEELMPSDVS
jgi:hypothetical protein